MNRNKTKLISMWMNEEDFEEFEKIKNLLGHTKNTETLKFAIKHLKTIIQ